MPVALAEGTPVDETQISIGPPTAWIISGAAEPSDVKLLFNAKKLVEAAILVSSFEKLIKPVQAATGRYASRYVHFR